MYNDNPDNPDFTFVPNWTSSIWFSNPIFLNYVPALVQQVLIWRAFLVCH